MPTFLKFSSTMPKLGLTRLRSLLPKSTITSRSSSKPPERNKFTRSALLESPIVAAPRDLFLSRVAAAELFRSMPELRRMGECLKEALRPSSTEP